MSDLTPERLAEMRAHLADATYVHTANAGLRLLLMTATDVEALLDRLEAAEAKVAALEVGVEPEAVGE